MGNAEVIGREQCPVCADNSANNLINYMDGGKHCFACGYHVNPVGYKFTPEALETKKMPVETAYDVLKTRKVSREVIKKYNVTLETREDGHTCVVFPVYTPDGELSGNHYRNVDVIEGKLTRDMYYEKGTKPREGLFGINTIGRGTKTLLLCEGETDTLIAATKLQGRKDVAVLGLLGAQFAKRAAAYLLQYAAKKKVVLALDNDAAGQKAANDIRDYVHKHDDRFPLFRMAIPHEHKDIGDWIAADDAAELDVAVEAAPEFVSNGLVGADDIAFRFKDYINKLKSKDFIRLEFSPTLKTKVRIEPGKFIGIIGEGGSGKSTFTEHIIMETIGRQKKNCLMVSAEMSPEEVAMKLARMATGIDYYDEDVYEELEDEDIDKLSRMMTKLLSRLYMHDRFGSCSVDEIYEHIINLERQGIHPDVVVIDNLLSIADDHNRDALGKISKDLKALAKATGVCIVLICHTKKPAIALRKKEVYRPTLKDIYGSSGMERDCDIIMGVSFDKAQGLVQVEALKLDRIGGKYFCVQFQFGEGRGSFQFNEVDMPSNDDDDEESEF